MIEEFTNKIHDKTIKICVIGLGQVGLPTALTFSDIGFHVTGLDINETLVKNLNSNICPFTEFGLDSLLERCLKKKFSTTTKFDDATSNSDVIIVCVATPLGDGVKPDLSALENVCMKLGSQNLTDKLIIIESSIPPGTFSGLILPLLENNKTNTQNFWFAFVPERLSPGQGLDEIRKTPRLIGYVDKESKNLTELLYRYMVTSEIFSASIDIVEISKLVENTYRDVNIALANEISLICEEYGIDVEELFKVCNSHPRVHLLKPGPGVGGPCLPKDPYLLLSPQGVPSITSKLITDSRKINDYMPLHVAELVTNSLLEIPKSPRDVNILIFGVAYKANVSDDRFSPAQSIISKLLEKNYQIFVYDPYTKETFGAKTINDPFSTNIRFDSVIVVTDHDEFKKIELQKLRIIMSDKPILVDTRRIFDKQMAENMGFNYISVGYVKNNRHQKIKTEIP